MPILWYAGPVKKALKLELTLGLKAPPLAIENSDQGIFGRCGTIRVNGQM